MNPHAVFAARVLLSLLFIVAGFGKLMGAADFAGYLGFLGVPGGVATAYAIGLFELAAGVMLLVGFQTAPAALALAAFCVATGLLAHLDLADSEQVSALLKNLGLAGGYGLLAMSGPGAFSIGGARTPAALR